MKRQHLGLTLLTSMAFVACSGSEPIESIKAISLVRALNPDANCEFSLSNETWAQGWYDPIGSEGMRVSLEVASSGLEPDDVVTFNQMRVCYSDPSRAVDESDNHSECDALVNTDGNVAGFFLETVAVNGSISGCTGEDCQPASLVDVEFMGDATLQDIYGDDFSANDISVWFSDAAMNGEGCCRYFYTDLFNLLEEDRLCCRGAIWQMGIATGPETGAPWGLFTPRPKMDLKVEFQMVGQSATGRDFTTAWLTLPTEVCPGCTRAHGETTECEDMVGEFCGYGQCTVDGVSEPCNENGCSDPSQGCLGFTYALTGQTPDVKGCVVSQMQGITQRCRDVVACEGN